MKPPRKGKAIKSVTRLHADLGELEHVRSASQGSASEPRPDPPAERLDREAVDWTARQSFQLLRGLTCAVTAELDLGKLVRKILDQARTVLGAERGVLFLGGPDASDLVPVLAVNLRGEQLSVVERVSRTILARARTGEIVVTHDALTDGRFSEIESVQTNRIHSIACIPLIGPSGQVGALHLDARRPGAFPEAVFPFLEAAAQIMAVALENARVHGVLRRDNAALRRRSAPPVPEESLIGSGAAMAALRQQAKVASLLDVPLVIQGEPGSGRTHLARSIHAASRRAPHPFVTLSLSAVPRSLVKRALFGGTSASPEGQQLRDDGVLAHVDRGTLHLTNADLLPSRVGAALAQALEGGSYQPIGARAARSLDVRLMISARPHDSTAVVVQLLPGFAGRDETTMTLIVPPLRERREDIPDLVSHALALAKTRTRFSPDAMEALMKFPWPGNIEQLLRVVRRILLVSGRTAVRGADVRSALEAVEAVGHGVGKPAPELRSLRDWENEAIRQALARTGGNKSRAARLLGIHRNTLALKLEELSR